MQETQGFANGRTVAGTGRNGKGPAPCLKQGWQGGNKENKTQSNNVSGNKSAMYLIAFLVWLYFTVFQFFI